MKTYELKVLEDESVGLTCDGETLFFECVAGMEERGEAELTPTDIAFTLLKHHRGEAEAFMLCQAMAQIVTSQINWDRGVWTIADEDLDAFVDYHARAGASEMGLTVMIPGRPPEIIINPNYRA